MKRRTEMVRFKMPRRRPEDGDVVVRRLEDDRFEVVVKTGGEVEALHITDYNACRVFGILGVLLKIPMSDRAKREIKL